MIPRTLLQDQEKNTVKIHNRYVILKSLLFNFKQYGLMYQPWKTRERASYSPIPSVFVACIIFTLSGFCNIYILFPNLNSFIFLIPCLNSLSRQIQHISLRASPFPNSVFLFLSWLAGLQYGVVFLGCWVPWDLFFWTISAYCFD